MTLVDFIKDDNRAYAIEIMNANATTVEEMIAAIHKANNMCFEFSHIVGNWIDICFGYDDVIDALKGANEKLERFIKFKNSKVAFLIAKHIENRTPEFLEEIKTEIEATNNPFEITIYEECFDCDSDTYFDDFYIRSLFTFYTTSKGKFDVDEDIERCNYQIKRYTEEKEKYKKLKEEMLAKYGDCLLEIKLYED